MTPHHFTGPDTASATGRRPIRVWDLVVRLGHWSLAASFGVAYLTAESESLRLIHVISGTVVLAVVLFRVVWGLVGPRTARFADFVKPLRAVMAYLASLLTRTPEHHTGHNPAGGWAVVALLSLAGMAAATGLAAYNDLGGSWVEAAHELLANLCLALVTVHVLAVVLSAWRHGENLILPMFTGIKLGLQAEQIAPRSGWLGAMLLIAWICLLTWAIR